MRIVYNSFDGRYSDSPRALYEGLVARSEPATHTWLAAPAHARTFPPAATTAVPGGRQALAALESADLVVSNTHLGTQWCKRPGARYLQTWHGTPLKHIAGDEPAARAAGVVPGAADVARWDLLLSPNRASTPRLRGAFGYTGAVLESGYPRNDALSAPGAPAERARVRAALGLRPGTTAVLYTPTWRDDVLDAEGRRDVELHLDLADAGRRLGRDHVLLLRLHYMVSDRLGPLDLPGVLDVSAHPDVRELYLAADAMVTDYSSTMVDFAVTGKPLLLFPYDLDHYRDDVRGLYVDLAAAGPGPLLRTSAEVVDALRDPVAATAAWAGRYAAFRDRYCHLDDGGATQRVLDAVLPQRVLDVTAGPALPRIPAPADAGATTATTTAAGAR